MSRMVILQIEKGVGTQGLTGQTGGDTRTIEIQLGVASYVATCVDTRRFKLRDEQVTYKNRNLRARAMRVTSKIVIYKPALRA